MRWYRNRGDLIDFISFVVAYAPSGFPTEDYREPHEQMNLNRAFDELRDGLARAAREVGALLPTDQYRAMLEEAYQHYLAGRRKEGAWKLQEMQEMLEKI